MRDAVGGTFMIKIFLIFLALYIIFVGVAVNYAKAFRVKNRIINIIEQNEGITNYTDNSSSSVLGQIKESLNEYHYKVQGSNRDQCPESQYGYMNDEYGYCIGLVTTGVENDGIVSSVAIINIDNRIIVCGQRSAKVLKKSDNDKLSASRLRVCSRWRFSGWK